MCILYARVVFALSTTKKKVTFVVIRTFLLLEIDVFITRGVCFSSDDDAEKKRNTCADKCANEPSLSYFIGLRVFCRAYAKYVSIIATRLISATILGTPTEDAARAFGVISIAVSLAGSGMVTFFAPLLFAFSLF